MDIRRSLLAAQALFLILASPLLADVRTQNIDIMVALDKSLSMEHKINAVKDWVNSYLIDQVVIPGDYLDIVAFYGKADVIVHQTIRNDADKAAVKKIISGIRGNGRFTDIGNALDVLKAQIATKEKDGRDKYVLLLTDGIQEAPPTSKYYSPDGKFNHEFLANTKTIQQKGWKVMILGIGTETAAKDLATALSSQYTEITGKLSSGALTQSAGGLFGDVTVQGPITVAPVGSDGSSSLSFTLKPSVMQGGEATVTVSRVDARIGSAPASPILTTPMTITVKKGQEKQARVPVKFPPGLPSGSGTATLSFAFPPGQGFSPSSFDISFKVKGWVENNTIPLGAGVVLAVLLIVALILLLRRATGGGPLAFLVLVDDSPLSETPMSLGPGHELFLNELEGSFSLISKRNARSLARFFVRDNKLGMGVLKADRFPKLAEVPADVRGQSFVLKTENGRKLDLEIQGRIPGKETAVPREASHNAETRESPGTEAKAEKAPRKARARPRAKASVARTGKRAK
jgi:von Willebrand factor type A domain